MYSPHPRSLNPSRWINPSFTYCNVSALRCYPSVPALASKPPIQAHRRRSPGWPPNIPNAVSLPRFHPYATGHHGPFRGPCGAPPSSGPWSSAGFSGTSSVTSADSVRIFQRMALTDKNMSVDMLTSSAGKGAGPLGEPMDQLTDSCLTRIQRDCLDSETGMVYYPQPKTSTSTSLGHIFPGVESVSSSSDRSSNYERPTADEPSKSYSPPASSDYSRDVDDRLMAPGERERHMQSLPDAGHSECPFSDKPPALPESGQHEHTSESDSDILLHFGLADEDLDRLASYPEDEVTPANLPSILRQIRSEKTKRSTPAAQLQPSPEPQPSGGVPGTAGHGVSSSRLTHQEEISPAVPEPGEAIGCERTDKCAGGAGDETGSVLPIDTSAGHLGEPPPESTTEVEIGTVAVSRDQTSSDPSLGKSLHSEAKLQIRQNPGSQATLGAFSPPKTHTEKSEASKPDPSKDPEADRRSTAKTQPPSSTRHRGERPRGPDLAVVGSDGTSGYVDRGESKDPTVVVERQQNEEKPPVRPDESPSVLSATGTVSRLLVVTDALRPQPLVPVAPPPVVARPPTIPEPTDLVLPPPSTEQPLKKPSWVPTAAIRSSISAAGKYADPATSSQTSPYRGKSSRSRSPIPRRHHRSESRSSRLRPRSPSGSRQTSPRRNRSSSRSPERRRSQRRREEGSSSTRRRDDRQSTPGRRRSPRRKSDERRSPRRRSRQRRSDRRKELSSKKSSAEELLKKSAFHLLSNQSDLEALVYNLAPIVLAKLTRSSSSSSFSNGGNTSLSSSSSSSPTAMKKLIKKTFKANPGLQTSETKTQAGKSSPPTMVKLKGIHGSFSRVNVLAAVERFGKIKSFLLFPSKLEATVCFEKEEDAEKLKSLKSLDANGIQIGVVGGQETVPTLPKPKPRMRSIIVRPLNASTATRTGLLPTPDTPTTEEKQPDVGKQQKQRKSEPGDARGRGLGLLRQSHASLFSF